MSEDGSCFGFAHFTVKEFLEKIDPTSDRAFAAYSIESRHANSECAKICLTYLTFQDSDQVGITSKDKQCRRLQEYALRSCAVNSLIYYTHDCDWSDTELLALAKTLFKPSKPGTLVSWVENIVYEFQDEDDIPMLRSGLAEATALHVAAMCGLSEVSKWLVENKCDVNRRTAFGTTLHCALLSIHAFVFHGCDVIDELMVAEYLDRPWERPSRTMTLETVNVLMEAGADPNLKYDLISESYSPLIIAVRFDNGTEIAKRLLHGGAKVDDQIMEACERYSDEQYSNYDYFKTVVAMTDTTNTRFGEKTRARALQFAPESQVSNFSSLLPPPQGLGEAQNERTRHNEISLRTAAEFGQFEVCKQLLDDPSIRIDAVENVTLRTALHCAAMNDHLEVFRILYEHGASIDKADCNCRTVVHYCVGAKGCQCLSFILPRVLDTTIFDNESLTVWHRAAEHHDVEALRLLVAHCKSDIPLDQLEGQGGPSLTSYAVQRSHAAAEDTILFLLDIGCTIPNADRDGRTALHHAAIAGMPEVVRLLIARGSSAGTLTNNGYNAIHYAMMSSSLRLDEVLDVLLKEGVNPFQESEERITPVELLIENSGNSSIKGMALRGLAELPETFECKSKGLTQALGKLCGLRPPHHSS